MLIVCKGKKACKQADFKSELASHMGDAALSSLFFCGKLADVAALVTVSQM